ncbi:MAG: restriction endonuclease subunit S, partial [Sphingobacteriaceae bacterium]|nr:restriction endonuclease subunit S [Sphingobacteriaceae bacterium]
NQHVMIIRPDERIFNAKFLQYYLLNRATKEYLLSIAASGATRNALTKGHIENLDIIAPSIEEQKKIAAILSSLDDKIELNRQTNQTLEEIAQTLFKEWFIDFNFPDENGNPYRDSGGAMIDSELGLIPASWSVGKLGGICEVISKGTTPTSLQIENLDKNIPFIKVKDIACNGTINISGLDLIPNDVHKKILKRSILKTGDILFSIAGTIGRVFILPENLNNSNCNQAVAFIRLKDREYLEFIHQHLISQNIQGLILGSVVQGVQANVSLTTLGNIPVLFPDEYSLMRFNCLIKPIYKKITGNNTQISSVVCIRDTLLPKLMSGKILIS